MKVKAFVEKNKHIKCFDRQVLKFKHMNKHEGRLSTWECFFEFSELNLRSLMFKTAFWYDSGIMKQ